jgi:hypothetical protein
VFFHHLHSQSSFFYEKSYTGVVLQKCYCYGKIKHCRYFASHKNICSVQEAFSSINCLILNRKILLLPTQISYNQPSSERAQQRKHSKMSSITMTVKSGQEMWRSKLGTDYPKEYMEKNEKRLLTKLQKIRDLPGNRDCADCGDRGTVWASVNLGVFLCMTW